MAEPQLDVVAPYARAPFRAESLRITTVMMPASIIMVPAAGNQSKLKRGRDRSPAELRMSSPGQANR